MRYSIISFDDNKFFDARITNNDMILIERYNKRNPLSIFSTTPPLGDLAFIIYMSLRHSSDFTLDDIYDFIDENDLDLEVLTAMVIRLFKDMGYVEDKEHLDESPVDIDESPQKDKESNAKQKEEIQTFKQITEKLLDSYLLLGTSEEFWNSNLEEVTTRFERHRKLLRSTSESDYMLAMMITSNIGMMLNGKGKKMLSVEDFFPHLYDEVDLEERERKARNQRIIEGFSNFAKNFDKNKHVKEVIEGDKIEIE